MCLGKARVFTALPLIAGIFLLSIAVGADENDVVNYADFEAEKCLEDVLVEGGTATRFEGEFDEGRWALRWLLADGLEPATLAFYREETFDLRPFSKLVWRWRAEGPQLPRLYLTMDSKQGSLLSPLPAPTSEWTELEIPLENMTTWGDFEPEDIAWIQLYSYRSRRCTIEIDSVRLVKGEGGWRGSRGGDHPEFKVADFEGAMASTRFSAAESKAEIVDSGDRGGGKVLRWTQARANDGGWLTFNHLPPDLTPYRWLSFKYRQVEGNPESLYVRIRSNEKILGAELPAATEKWQVVSICLPDMRRDEGFDPKEEYLVIRLVCFETAGFVVEVDDLVLKKEGDGYEYSARERLAMGVDLTAPIYRIADFERRVTTSCLVAVDSAVEQFPLKRSRKKEGSALRWKVDPRAGSPVLNLRNVPVDIRKYRTLRMRARVNRRVDQPIEFRFRSMEGGLEAKFEGLTSRWKTYEFALPKMSQWGEFDPKDVMLLRFDYEGEKGFQLELDDIELVKGAGGWVKSKDQQLADVFGEDRYRKTKEIETDHFVIWTDSKAARKKFPKALEKTYEFVCQELGIDGFEGKLPVYIFQNSDLYAAFCVRKGWSKGAALATAGHASASYFATYYQAPDSAVVTHELTHSIFNRARGVGGGSWFQEGVAVYVEERWQKRSPAVMFAPALRSGKFVPLPQLIQTKRLIGGEDIKGGAGSAGALYSQAGAFFEFLLRGPFAKLRPEAIRSLAVLDYTRSDVVPELEKILGATIEEIEDLWIEWGENPPK